MRAPREIVALSNETVVSVSVSLTHALCATSHGNVYVWGNNRYRKSGDFEVQGFLGVKDPPILYVCFVLCGFYLLWFTLLTIFPET